MSANSTWALILAAGDGSRLHSLTTPAGGLAIPKQFCSLQGGASLLEETLRRARRVVDHAQIVTVVAAQHRNWWDTPLRSAPADNIIVQPQNKGTGIGLLLPLLHIAQRDANATVIILPSDHFVRKKSVLARAVQQAAGLACVDHRHIYLLGVAPEQIDPELGYIVPHAAGGSLALPVRLFVEKPSVDVARGLVQAGALCNVFILAASVRSLIGLYATRYPNVLEQLSVAADRDALRTRAAPAARALYPQLPTLDFCRDVLEAQEPLLRVLKVPACGWSDLGTPRRVAEALSRIGHSSAPAQQLRPGAYLSLAAQHSLQPHAS